MTELLCSQLSLLIAWSPEPSGVWSWNGGDWA